jgi:phosphoglucomutase
MTDAPARAVMEQITSVAYFEPEHADFAHYIRCGLISYVSNDLWESYYAAVLSESINPEVVSAAGVNVVYTPLCGAGNQPVREILKRLRANVTIVACQEHPDGDFKTCEYPNPETEAALQESYKVANQCKCDVILATDPDCDRIAIAVPDADGYKKLSGNELGCLLLEYILRERSAKCDLPADPIVVKSIVSTPLADRIARKYGVTMRSVLTGFKYIGGEILALEQKQEEKCFVFGFEESCGYLKGTYARDKDAVVASMLVCELVASLKLKGKSILDAVREMYDNYGYFLSNVESIELTGPDAMEKASNLMGELRANLPEEIGGARVTLVRDYHDGFEMDMITQKRTPINLPASNVLEFVLGEKGSVIVRPSGTEPKVKYYYTAVGATIDASNRLLTKIKKQMRK